MHTERRRIRTVFLLASGSIFLISGIVGLLWLSTAHNNKSFGTVFASFSVIAGTYFLLDTYLLKRSKETKRLREHS